MQRGGVLLAFHKSLLRRLTERASAREGDASNAVKAHRRQSLQVLSNVMGGAAYSGDKFGQRGACRVARRRGNCAAPWRSPVHR